MTASYNVQHAPMGAFASFTVGHFGSRGGLAAELGRPGNSNVYIGYRVQGETRARLLPFYEASAATRETFEVGQAREAAAGPIAIDEAAIERELTPATEEFRSGPLCVRILSPFFPIEDPRGSSREQQRRAACPAVFVELTVDNRDGLAAIEGIFALEDDTYREISGSDLVGFAMRDRRGFACRAARGLRAFLEFELAEGLLHAGTRLFRLGRTAGFVLDVPAGECRTLVVALAVWNPGVVTTGEAGRYWYSRVFDGLEDVLKHALETFSDYEREAQARCSELEQAPLNPAQRFLLCQAIHSYFGSSQWLEVSGEPLWVVNEGEYVMMNTLDLTVDQAFFELRYFPWAVRSELEFYAKHYSYRDEVRRPGSAELLPGGVSFCHDHGVANQFSPRGHSAYEVANLPAKCFSYMSYEELTNWVLCAGLYVAKTADDQFARRFAALLRECLQSLLNRDDPDPKRRSGVMGCDGVRSGTGAEITTYDSLDASLGQARNNLYLACKTWASFVALEWLLARVSDATNAELAAAAAVRAAHAIVAHWDPALGYIPAVFEGGNRSAIIPAIEALVYPKQMGLEEALSDRGPYRELIVTLRRHFESVLRTGLCQFEDGGWKLSSTSDNSWMSKIAIAQYVAREILGVRPLPEEQRRQDEAHAQWQRRGSGYWAFSDQMVAGAALGSRYYPRGVTAILWLDERAE